MSHCEICGRIDRCGCDYEDRSEAHWWRCRTGRRRAEAQNRRLLSRAVEEGCLEPTVAPKQMPTPEPKRQAGVGSEAVAEAKAPPPELPESDRIEADAQRQMPQHVRYGPVPRPKAKAPPPVLPEHLRCGAVPYIPVDVGAGSEAETDFVEDYAWPPLGPFAPPDRMAQQTHFFAPSACSRCKVFRPFARLAGASCSSVLGVECTYGESDGEAEQQEPYGPEAVQGYLCSSAGCISPPGHGGYCMTSKGEFFRPREDLG